MSQMDDVSRAIGLLQGQLEAITTEVRRYHSIAEDERHEMREELKELRRELAELKSIRDQGKGWLGALTFAAAIVGSALTAAIGHFWPGA